jgi:hypothetical protein
MSFYSLKHALEPAKIDAAVDATVGLPASAAVTTAVNDIATLKAALPTTNPGAGFLWNDAGVIKMGTT